MQIGASSSKARARNDQLQCQERGQGHGRLKLDFEAWQRHHSGPPWVE